MWQTYQYVNERMTDIASGLVGRCGLTAGTFVGIMMINRPEWTIVEQACSAQSLVTVPLYDTLGSNVIEYIANESDLSLVVCSKETLPKLLAAAPACNSLRGFVCADRPEDADRLRAKELGLNLWTISELESYGASHRVPHNPPKPTDIATLCYTSGIELYSIEYWGITGKGMGTTGLYVGKIPYSSLE